MELKLRNEMKKKKPVFVRSGYGNIKGLDKRWRKPKGMHSKMRLKKKGRRKLPNMGYRSPKGMRGLNQRGLREVLVNNIGDLSNINNKTQIALISKKVGLKNKLRILKMAQDLKVNIGNTKNIEEFLKRAEQDLEERKQETKNKKEKRKKAKEKVVEESKEKKKEEKLDEEKKKEETKKAIEMVQEKPNETKKETTLKQPKQDIKGLQKRIGRTV